MLRARHSFSFNVILVCPTRLPFISFAYFPPFHASSFSIFHFFVLFPLSRPVFFASRHFAFLFPPVHLLSAILVPHLHFRIRGFPNSVYAPTFQCIISPNAPSHLFSSPY